MLYKEMDALPPSDKNDDDGSMGTTTLRLLPPRISIPERQQLEGQFVASLCRARCAWLTQAKGPAERAESFFP